MKSPRNLDRHLMSVTVAVVGLLSGLALPGHCWSRPLSYQTITQSVTSPGWVPTGDLNTPRYGHTATLLPNGKVLVAGGATRAGNRYTLARSAELYDPDSGTWSHTADLNAPRVFHTATLLPNGRVLVAGGNGSNAPPSFGVTNTAELYDPDTGTWSYTGNLDVATTDHTATLLQNGKVLVAGGWAGGNTLNKAELYDPDTRTWTITGSLVAARYWQTATLLKNGKVLVAGGSDDGDLASALASVELYDPESGTWSVTADLSTFRVLHTATLLPSGEVLVAGGYNWPPVSLASAEMYDLATGKWTDARNLGTGREGDTATLLPSGEVIIAGGYDWNRRSSPTSVERYDPDTGTWSSTTNLNTVRVLHTATLLQNGTILVVGGDYVTSTYENIPLSSVELYEPATSVVIPRITSASVQGRKLFLFGESFEPGAVILLNGEEQRTTNDDQNPRTVLIGKKAGKKIKLDDKLQVRNPNGTLSEVFTFTGS